MCVIDHSKFNRVFACEIAKEMWDTLVTTYEEASQVQATKLSIYVYQHELFEM